MDYFQIDKYLSNNATEEEVALLFKWIDASPENKRTFIQYKKAWALTSIGNAYSDQMWKQTQKRLHKNRLRRLFSNGLKYAAIFIGIIGISFFFLNKFDNSNNLIIKNNVITLELENGNIEVLTELEDKKIIDSKGNVIGVKSGGELRYEDITALDSSSKNSKEELVYNELKIPHGKIFQVVLSDGTKAFLNAGSTLKYPVNFVEGKVRKVFLDGEAFFDVAKDTNHPFVVNVNEMNVRVLGTKFNIASYSEDKFYKTVLLEGSVAIYKKGTPFNLESAALLKPGYSAEWDKKSEEILFEMVDTHLYTDWMSGKLVFVNATFKNIRKKLERHYNVTIVNNNKTLDEKTYSAIFDIESIEQVLETLNKSFAIKYQIKNNQIIIN